MTTRYKSILALALLVLVASFSIATATEVRVGSMGGVGFYTHDNSNIFYFPGAIYTYSGQVYGEFRVKDTDNSYTIGVNYPITDYAVIGGYLNRPIAITLPQIAPGIGPEHINLNQTTDLFYGAQMSDFDFGLKLSIGMDKYKNSPVEEKASYYSLGAGISNEKTDLGLIFELPSAKYDSTGITNKFNGFGFGALARTFIGSGNTKYVPLGLFSYRTANTKIGTPEVKTDFKDMNFAVGIGLNHQLNENSLLVLAAELFGLQSTKTEPPAPASKITDSRQTLPGLYMGVESKFKPWLTGRVGAAQVWQDVKHKVETPGAPTVETSIRESQYNVSFGLGFNFGDFTADATINEGIFFDGPNFISGETNALANRLALIYKF